ncbi:MAG: glycerate kinase [Mariniblastus sp.]
MSLKDDAITIWKSGVAAVDACKLVRESVMISSTQSSEDHELWVGEDVFPLSVSGRVIVVGFGKASGAMVVGLEKAFADHANSLNIEGWVNVPNDPVALASIARQREPTALPISIVGCRPPGANLPTQEVLNGTDKIINLVRNTTDRDIVVCLISGGGSALLEKPVDPISLNEFRDATMFLSNAGASIYELNSVRRVISQVKGGGLSRLANCPVVSLVISDVIGDPLDVIASGPTNELVESDHVATSSPLEIMKKYDQTTTKIAKSVWQTVEANVASQRTPANSRAKNFIIGNIETAMLAAREKATELGYSVELTRPDGDEGDAELVGRAVAIEIARTSADLESKPVCKIMGGETTVSLCDSPGRGGRNQHLVASATEALLDFQIDEQVDYVLLSGGTDGEDGNVSAAGAISGRATVQSLRAHDSAAEKIRQSILDCNSHTFLSEHGMLLEVPPTFTNVCDLRVVLMENKSDT